MIVLMFIKNRDVVFKDLKDNKYYSIINGNKQEEKELIKFAYQDDWEDCYELFANEQILKNFINESLKEYEDKKYLF